MQRARGVDHGGGLARPHAAERLPPPRGVAVSVRHHAVPHAPALAQREGVHAPVGAGSKRRAREGRALRDGGAGALPLGPRRGLGGAVSGLGGGALDQGAIRLRLRWLLRVPQPVVRASRHHVQTARAVGRDGGPAQHVARQRDRAPLGPVAARAWMGRGSGIGGDSWAGSADAGPSPEPSGERALSLSWASGRPWASGWASGAADGRVISHEQEHSDPAAARRRWCRARSAPSANSSSTVSLGRASTTAHSSCGTAVAGGKPKGWSVFGSRLGSVVVGAANGARSSTSIVCCARPRPPLATFWQQQQGGRGRTRSTHVLERTSTTQDQDRTGQGAQEDERTSKNPVSSNRPRSIHGPRLRRPRTHRPTHSRQARR